MHLKEIEKFKKQVVDKNEALLKFTRGQKNLELFLSSQKCVFDKSGIGYKPHSKQKF